MSAQHGVTFDAETHDDLAPQLLEPTYQNRLRVVGRRLDRNALHSPTVIEVDGGFIVRAHQGSDPIPVLMEVFDRDFPLLIREAAQARVRDHSAAFASDLVPTGYEDLLRALGYELDERLAENVVIAEYPGFLSVSGFELVIDAPSGGCRPFADVLTMNETKRVLDEAFMRRGTVAIPRIYIPPSLRGIVDMDG